jgi:long-chain acyl-CoA synthetase
VAGVTNTVNLFPFLEPTNEKDTVVSAFGLATPFGRSVAYTALYAGANFTTLPSTNTLREGGELAAGELSAMRTCSRVMVQAPQRIRQTSSAP